MLQLVFFIVSKLGYGMQKGRHCDFWSSLSEQISLTAVLSEMKD